MADCVKREQSFLSTTNRIVAEQKVSVTQSYAKILKTTISTSKGGTQYDYLAKHFKSDSFINHSSLFLYFSAYFTSKINTGTSINGPTTAAKASPELMPKTAIETAMASSKLLPVAVKDIDADLS